MDVYLFRLSLKEREAPDLFSFDAPAAGMDREAWLRHVFGTQRHFRHYGSDFIYRPEQSTAPPRSTLIFGWFGRVKRMAERTPPEEGFLPTEHGGWQAIFVALDPVSHDNGQKLAIEYDSEIGRPGAILSSFVRDLNSDGESPYSLNAFPILSAGSFWDFAHSHRNEIITLSFDVAVPNMFNGVSDFEEELRALQKNENVAEVDTTLKSDGVLKHDSERIRDIVNYVDRGAGKLSAEALDGAIYKSSEHEVHVSVEMEHHSNNIDRFWRDISDWIDKVFL